MEFRMEKTKKQIDVTIKWMNVKIENVQLVHSMKSFFFFSVSILARPFYRQPNFEILSFIYEVMNPENFWLQSLNMISKCHVVYMDRRKAQ